MHEKDSVWVRGRDGDFEAGTIVAIEECSVTIDVGRKKRAAKLDELFEREETIQTKDDCCGLTYLNEANIIANLKERYKADEIYTFTSAVLLALNPYKSMSQLYSQNVQKQYHNLAALHAKPPHPYALADLAYRHLIYDKKNQACVISGESGAGKTETAKIVMGFLAQRSRTAEEQSSGLQHKILEGANPILESLGNATTVRNGNSSRFGKYNMFGFNPVGNLVGAEVRTYLLENCRVVAFGAGERTYHVFYELLYGHPNPAQFNLQPTKNYKLLTGPNNAPMKRRDKENFAALQKGFSYINFEDVQQEALYSVIAGIVHLGEIEFVPTKTDGTEIGDMAPLDCATKLLGMDVEKLTKILLFREMKVRNGRSNEVFYSPRTQAYAILTLESLMKMLYKRAFDHVVDHINSSLSSGGVMDSVKHIGILDIYGFEQLQKNSFEQLCINLANERLQDFFVQNVLNFEQELYKKEGLPWEEIDTPDAGPVIESLGDIFCILDDHNWKVAKNQDTSDAKFTGDVHRKFVNSDKNSVIQGPKRGRAVTKALDASQGFVVKHFAGEVQYETAGFLEKNNARLMSTMESLIRDSTHDLTSRLTDDGSSDEGRLGFSSVAKKYVVDLQDLMDTLGSCDLHYVRCYKPNLEQKPNLFNVKVTLEQLIQSGTVELVQIMHDGFPHRCLFADLKERFLPYLPQEFRGEDPRMFLEALMFVMNLDRKDWTIGTSRLFLKSGKLAVLDSLKSTADGIPPETISQLKLFMRRKKLRRCLHAIQLSVWLPKFQRRVRMQRLFEGLRTACHTYIRLYRWLKRVRSRLRAEQITQTCMELRSSVFRYVRIMRWMDKSVSKVRARRKARAEELLQCWTRRAMLYAHVKRWMAKCMNETMKKKRTKEQAETLLSYVARRALLNVHLLRYVRSKASAIRQRRAKAQASLTMLHQRSLLFVHVRRWAHCRALAIRQRKCDTCNAYLTHLARRSLLLVHTKRWVQSRSASIRERKRRTLLSHLSNWSRHTLLLVHTRRWVKSRAASIRERERIRAETTCVHLTVLARRALLCVHVRRWVLSQAICIRERKRAKASAHLTVLARQALLNARMRAYVKACVGGIRRRKQDRCSALLVVLARRAHLFVCMRQYVRRKSCAIRERKKAMAQASLAIFFQHALLTLHVRRWMRRAVTCFRDRKRCAQLYLTALARRALLFVHLRRWVVSQATSIRERKRAKASAYLTVFARRAMLTVSMRAYVSTTVGAIRKRKQDRCSALLAEFARRAHLNVCLRRYGRRQACATRERKKAQAQASLGVFFQHVLLTIHVRRWMQSSATCIRDRKRKCCAQLYLTVLARRALLFVHLRRWVVSQVTSIRERKRAKASAYLTVFARRALLTVSMRAYVSTTVGAIRKRKQDRCSALLAEFARRAHLNVCLRRYGRRQACAIRKRKRAQALSALAVFTQHVLLTYHLRYWVRHRALSFRERRKSRAQSYLNFVTRHALLRVQLGRWVKSRAATIRRIQRAKRARAYLSVMSRRALLVVHMRRWAITFALDIRDRKMQKTCALLTAMAQVALLNTKMKMFVRKTVSQIRQRKHDKCSTMLLAFVRRALLNVRLRRFVRCKVCNIRERKRRKVHALLATFTQRATLYVGLHRYVRRKLYVLRDMGHRVTRAEERLTDFSRHALLVGTVVRWTKDVVTRNRNAERERARALMDAAIALRRQQRERPRIFVQQFVRHTLLVTYLRPWLLRSLRNYRAQCDAGRRKKALRGGVMLVVYLQRHVRLRVETMRFLEREFLFAEAESRIQTLQVVVARREFLLGCLCRHALLVSHLHRYIRTRPRRCCEERLSMLARYTLLVVEMRKYMLLRRRQKSAQLCLRRQRFKERQRVTTRTFAEHVLPAVAPQTLFDRCRAAEMSDADQRIDARHLKVLELDAAFYSDSDEDSPVTPPPVSRRPRAGNSIMVRGSTGIVTPNGRMQSGGPNAPFCHRSSGTLAANSCSGTNGFMSMCRRMSGMKKRSLLDLEPEKEPSEAASAASPT